MSYTVGRKPRKVRDTRMERLRQPAYVLGSMVLHVAVAAWLAEWTLVRRVPAEESPRRAAPIKIHQYVVDVKMSGPAELVTKRWPGLADVAPAPGRSFELGIPEVSFDQPDAIASSTGRRLLLAAPSMEELPDPLAQAVRHSDSPLASGDYNPLDLDDQARQFTFFGVAVEGDKCVFVIDRSGSMGPPRDLLSAAKRQLLAVLASLDELAEFQVIFYNDNHSTLRGQTELLVKTDAEVEAVARELDGVTASGGTSPMPALRTAIRMGAEEIFFLTDGEFAVSDAELDALRQQNSSQTTVNTIQFGTAEMPSSDLATKRIADATNGTFQYLQTGSLTATNK